MSDPRPVPREAHRLMREWREARAAVDALIGPLPLAPLGNEPITAMPMTMEWVEQYRQAIARETKAREAWDEFLRQQFG